MAETRVIRNDGESRYEVTIDGLLAQLVYRVVGDRIALLHTEVPEELGGQGIAGELAQFAMDDAKARGLTVIVYCPFVKSWLGKHPEIAERQPIEIP